MANSGGMELADLLGYLGRRADGTVALGGGTHIHGVADAQRLGRLVQCPLVAVAEAREHEMGRSEVHELAANLLRCRLDGAEPLGEHLGRYRIREPAVGEASGAPERRLRAAAAPDRRAPRPPRR